jgi:hypothetical protein
MNRWRITSTGAKALLVMFAVLAGGAALLIASTRGGSQADQSASGSSPTRAQATEARFAALSVAHSNRCDLEAGELQSMPGSKHLRGACCNPIDRASYISQLRGLQRFAGDRLVPSNPYDVSVRLAKRLLSYRDISLTASQRAVYRRASQKSDTGGPCCCPCWRWEAFKGQARFMIARRAYSATEVARLWELEQGCGGPSESA